MATTVEPLALNMTEADINMVALEGHLLHLNLRKNMWIPTKAYHWVDHILRNLNQE